MTILGYFKKYQVYLWVLFVIILVTYANSLFNPFISDDIEIIGTNHQIQSFNYVLSGPLTPIRPLLYYLTYHIFGAQPIFFRLINIFFHSLTVFTVFGLLILLLRDKTLAFIMALIYAVDPILTETVAWISGGTNAQYGFFLMASLFFYVLSKKSKKMYLYWSVIFFLLSIFSSQKALVLPFILVMYEVCFSSLKKNWKNLIPFFIFGGIFTLMYGLQIGSRSTTVATQYYIEGGLENPLTKLPFAITKYIQLTLLPIHLTLYHAEPVTIIEYIIRIIALVLFFFAYFISYKKNKFTFFWLSFFLITLLPVLTPLKVSSTFAERYVYLGAAGIIIVAVYWIDRLLRHYKIHSWHAIVYTIIILFFFGRTFLRNMDWQNELGFWEATVKESPNESKVHNNLGIAYFKNNRVDLAVEHFKIGNTLNPRDADIVHNLAYAFFYVGQFKQAVPIYEQAIKLNPTNWNSYNDLGAVYISLKDYDKAEAYFNEALKYAPNSPLIYFNLARVNQYKKNFDQARMYAEKALELSPGDPLITAFLQQLDSLQKK